LLFISEVKKQQAERAGSVGLKDTEVFYLLVFLYRMGCYAPGRPHSRVSSNSFAASSRNPPNFSAKNPASSFPSDFFTLNRHAKKCEHVILRASERYPAAQDWPCFILLCHRIPT